MARGCKIISCLFVVNNNNSRISIPPSVVTSEAVVVVVVVFWEIYQMRSLGYVPDKTPTSMGHSQISRNTSK